MGPSRGEIRLRLGISLIGLGLMGVALWRHGVTGIAALEIVGIAGLLFGGTAIWALWKLLGSRD